ncbi:MAG: glycoside hydrolase family 3 protein [Clostridium sp.]
MKKFMLQAALLLSLVGVTTMNTGALSTTNGLDTKDKIKKKISTMTLQEKVGQMMFVGVDGTKVDHKTMDVFEDMNVGGVILYGWRNFYGTSIDKNIKFISDLKKGNSQNSNIPLFVGFDEEGGVYSHLPQEIPKTPAKGEIGNFNDPNLAEEFGVSIGSKLKSVGINVDFGTVLDINTNPNNPVIGARSFGATPEKVTEFGMREIKGIESKGIIPTVKHFPGHGDTDVDSHVGLPSLPHDMERLKKVELAPFQKAIDNGVDMLMTAHIMLPALDKEYPATMSKKILTDLLRKDMGYKGVVITDDLEMQAIKNNWGLGEAAIKCVEAGVDIMLVCHTAENQKLVYDSIVQAVQDGKLSEDRIDESVERILTLKGKYNLQDTKLVYDENKFYEEINTVYESIGNYYNRVVQKMYE